MQYGGGIIRIKLNELLMKTPHQKFIEFMKKGGTIKSDQVGVVRSSGAAAAFLVAFFCLEKVWGLDVSSVSGIDISSRFRTLYKTEGHVEYGIVGESMVEKNQKRPFSRFEWKGTATGETKKGKYYLIWVGVVEPEKKGAAKKILFRAPSGKEWNVKASRFEMSDDEADGAYLAISDVGRMMEGKGIYKVRNLETKPDRFGGYTWIGIYENPNVSKRHIELKVGLAKLKPGELYEAKILESGQIMNGWTSRVSTFGGDGKAGNGSSNLLNRMALSGGEDWDGSSGDKWDVDSYNIEKFGLISDKGLTWSIDPLLQWLYAAGIVVQIDLSEKNRGGEKK